MRLSKKFAKIFVVGSISAFSILGTANLYAANLGFTTGDQINIRNGASIEADILSKLPAGQPIEIIALESDWYQIKSENGVPAYVSRDFVKLVQADGVVNDNGVNIRDIPGTTGTILGSVDAGALLSVNGIAGDFYDIDYNGTKAFIHKNYLDGNLLSSLEKSDAPIPEPTAEPAAAETEYALITSSTGLNLRQQPSQTASVLATLPVGMAVDLIENGAEWKKVCYNGTEGYVSAEFVSIHTGAKPESSRGTQIIEYAKQFLGTPYAWSGTNLNKGVDCSGFTYAVLRDNGISVNRSSRDQFRNGVNVSKDELKAGDLVFFDTTNATNQGYISHVGLYMGGGQFIHSSSSRKSYCVTISSLSEDYYTMRYVGARRVL